MSEISQTVRISEDEHVLRAKIDRPNVLNALNEQVIDELSKALDQAIASGCRALVIESEGDKAFVAGADIAAMSDMTAEQAYAFSQRGHALTRALESAPLVTIAKVQGFALGGGCELAMACDIVIAADSAIFGQPEVDLGLIAGFGGTQRLVHRVGRPLAMDMLVGGRKITGTEAFHCGLVSNCVEKDKLEDTLQKTLKQIRRAAPKAISASKLLVNQAREVPLGAGLAAEASAFANCFSRDEAHEGTKAFLEKRKASFSL